MKQEKLPIVCFAGCDWWYHNKGLFCPQVMTRLVRDYKVLFVNSLGMRIPSLIRDKHAFKKVTRKLGSMLHFLRKTEDGMYVLSPISLPFVGRIGRKLNTFSVFLQVKLAAVLLKFREPVVYIGCPPALEVANKLGQRRFLIYERTDLFEEMPGANKYYIASLDRELAESADLVLYVNKELWRQGVNKNKNSLFIGHGVDFERFAGAEKSNYTPEDIAVIPKPVIGFFGDVTEDVCDFALLGHIAEKLPNMSFVFIGPISADVSGLKQFNNVHFLGPKPYEQVPFYGKEFDVAIMPWNKNKWIEFCNPVKIKEYLALGKPVVSTYYPEIETYSDVVYVADSYDLFVSLIQKAAEENDSAKVQQRREIVKNETWDNKVEQIKAFIEETLTDGDSN